MVQRGEIYLVNWDPARGSEQTGVRPALVIQNDIGNRYSPTTIVAAVSTAPPREYPFHVRVGPEESGLPQESVVKLEQIMTISKERFVRRLGKLSEAKMKEVDRAIHRSLGLRD